MSRGNARQPIFLDPDDHAGFLRRLSKATKRYAVRCLAYCLMKNHFHLLLEPADIPLSRMMQQLNSSYSSWFNKRHDRDGHVLKGRFEGIHIDRDDYFRRTLRYIVRNPVRAGLVEHPADWPWSSYRATAGFDTPPSFLAVDDVWRAFDADDDAGARKRYRDFVDATGVFAGSDGSSEILLYGSDAFSTHVEPILRERRNTIDHSYAERFACRLSLERLFTNAHGQRAIDSAMHDAYERYGYTLREIGQFTGWHPATVWKRIRKNCQDVDAG